MREYLGSWELTLIHNLFHVPNNEMKSQNTRTIINGSLRAKMHYRVPSPFFCKSLIMTVETDIIQPVKDFVRDSKFLLNRCTKPDKKGLL